LFKNTEDNLIDDAIPIGSEGDSGRQGPGRTVAEFRKMYDAAFPILFRVAYRIANNREAAEDLCQEGFFRLYEKNMVFPNPEEAKYWLIRVVKNAALNYAKRKERERKAYQRAFKEDHRQEETGEGLLVKKETRIEVKEALDKLPENLRMVLVLKEYGDMNYKEISKVLGINEGNVKVRVFRARERLAALLASNLAAGSMAANNLIQGGTNVS